MLDEKKPIEKLTNAQLADLARSAGLEVRSRMNKSELIELVSQIDDGEAVRETVSLRRDRRTTRLRGKLEDSAVSASRYSWHNALETAIQDSIRRLSERFVNNYFVTGMRDLESVIFARSLTSVGGEWQEEGRRLPPQLSLFGNPVGLIAFQVHERRYRCVKYPPQEGNGGFTKEQLKRYRFAVNSLSKTYSSSTTTLEEHPTSPELCTPRGVSWSQGHGVARWPRSSTQRPGLPGLGPRTGTRACEGTATSARGAPSPRPRGTD